MKFFGLYLVEQGLITSSQLVEALLEQSSALPSPASVAYSKKLLDDAKLLKVFAKQTESHSDFRSACQSLGFWNGDLEGKIQGEIDAQRMPLGHVLVKKKSIDIGKLTKALDEFLSRAELPSEASTTAAAAPADSKIDDAMLDEFLDFYSENKLAEFTNILDLWDPTLPDVNASKEFLKDLLQRVHTLKGMATCVRLPATQGLLGASESAMSSILESATIDTGASSRLKNFLSQVIQMLNSLRKMVAAEKSESGFVQKFEKEIAELNNQFGALKK
jgi:hypothetical protein